MRNQILPLLISFLVIISGCKVQNTAIEDKRAELSANSKSTVRINQNMNTVKGMLSKLSKGILKTFSMLKVTGTIKDFAQIDLSVDEVESNLNLLLKLDSTRLKIQDDGTFTYHDTVKLRPLSGEKNNYQVEIVATGILISENVEDLVVKMKSNLDDKFHQVYAEEGQSRNVNIAFLASLATGHKIGENAKFNSKDFKLEIDITNSIANLTQKTEYLVLSRSQNSMVVLTDLNSEIKNIYSEKLEYEYEYSLCYFKTSYIDDLLLNDSLIKALCDKQYTSDIEVLTIINNKNDQITVDSVINNQSESGEELVKNNLSFSIK